MSDIAENNNIKNEKKDIDLFCIFTAIITVAVIACLSTCVCGMIVVKDRDASFNYSHEIRINMDTRKTSLESWHQALVDSVYISAPWDYRNFHPSVIVNIDSVHVDYPLELDSLTVCLSKIDQIYNEYYNDALNDLRQESNNIISKWSGWLGFWVSVLALLMGILPIALQFKLSSRSQERLQREIEELEKQYQAKEKELDEKSKMVEDNIQKQKLARLKSKVVNVINAIDLGKNNKLLSDSHDRNFLLWTLLKDLRKLFCEFVKTNKKVDVCSNEDKYNDLLIVLIEIHGVVTKLIPFLQHKSKSRRIHDFQSDLQKIIFKIANDNSCVDYEEIDTIQEKFSQLVDEFK